MRIARRIGGVMSAAIFVAFVWAPVAPWFAAPAVLRAPEVLSLIAPGGRRAWLLCETTLYAMGSAVLSAGIGLGAALYCWSRRTPIQRFIGVFALITAAIPPYLHALVWLPITAALPARGAGPTLGWFTAGWVQALAMVPFCFGVLTLALADLDIRLLEAGRLLGSDRRLLSRIVLPSVSAAVVASCALIFLLTLPDPSVPSLFSTDTYAMEVYSEFGATHDPVRSILLSTPLAFAGLIALGILSRSWRSVAQRPRFANPPPRSLEIGAGSSILRLSAMLAALPVMMLVGGLLRQLWPPARWVGSFDQAMNSLGLSIGTSAIAAALACLPSFSLSKLMLHRPVAAWWFVAAPLAIPASLTGTGLIWLWNRNLPAAIAPYGTWWMLVLAELARFAPLAVMIMAVWRSRLDPVLIQAAGVFGSSWTAFARVELPLLLPGATAAFAVVFGLSLGELGASLLVAPPGPGTLALRIYNYLHYGASGPVAVLALFLVSGAAAAVTIGARMWKVRY